MEMLVRASWRDMESSKEAEILWEVFAEDDWLDMKESRRCEEARRIGG
jgi:hypothetical protein